MTARTEARLAALTARTALIVTAFTVTGWTIYIAIGGLT